MLWRCEPVVLAWRHLGAWTVAGVLAGAVPGCIYIPEGDSTTERDGQWLQRNSARGVFVDALILHTQPDRTDAEAVWKAADEGVFAPALRTRLARNGLRAAVADPDATPEVTRLLQRKVKGRYTVAKWAVTFAQPRPLPMSADDAERTFLMSGPDGKITGRQYELATCQLWITARPGTEGNLEVTATPVVEHGRTRRRIKSDPVTGRITSIVSRQREPLSFLGLSATIRPGQVLLIGRGAEAGASSVGQHFFMERGTRGLESKLLVLRFTRIDGQRRVEPPIAPAATR